MEAFLSSLASFLVWIVERWAIYYYYRLRLFKQRDHCTSRFAGCRNESGLELVLLSVHNIAMLQPSVKSGRTKLNIQKNGGAMGCLMTMRRQFVSVQPIEIREASVKLEFKMLWLHTMAPWQILNVLGSSELGISESWNSCPMLIEEQGKPGARWPRHVVTLHN